jgi:hypothetical protein
MHYTQAKKHVKHLVTYSKHLLLLPDAYACLLTTSSIICKNCTIANKRAPKAKLPK